MPSRVCTHSGEWTPSVWARVTEVLFRVRVRVERISCGTYRVERRVQVVWNVVSHFSFSHNMFSCSCNFFSACFPRQSPPLAVEVVAARRRDRQSAHTRTTSEHRRPRTANQDPAMIKVSKKLSKTRITIPLPGALMRALPWGSGRGRDTIKWIRGFGATLSASPSFGCCACPCPCGASGPSRCCSVGVAAQCRTHRSSGLAAKGTR